jgi:hypothetical protein
MKRQICLFLLLTILLALPQVVYASNQSVNGSAGNTLTEALGTLAVYAAIIAALAAGVEVITDLLRPLFGLERQPQAMETLNRMKEWLPATLKEMEVDPQAQARLQTYLSQLDSTVREVEGLADRDRIAQEIQRWALGAVRSVGTAATEQLEARLEELGKLLKEQYGLQDADVASALDSALQVLRALQSGELLEERLQEFKDLLSDLNLDASQTSAALTKALEAAGALVGDEQLAKQLRELLTELGVPDDQMEATIAQALKILNGIKEAQGAQQVIRLAASLESFSGLLDMVESQRSDVISYFRRWWRALRDWNGLGLTRLVGKLPDWIRERSLIGVILYALEVGWNWLWGKGEAEEQLKMLLTPETVAQVLLDRDRTHQLQEVHRQRWLRFVTVVIGMALAVVVRIDSLELLRPLFGTNLPRAVFDPHGVPYTLEQIVVNLLGRNWAVERWWGFLRWSITWMEAATPGMLLSGLAASGGSSFWHDQLDRLRATKKVAEQVTSMVGQFKSSESER